MSQSARRVAIIGAGPIGLEAAIWAATHNFDVKLFERGRVADNILHWGHVKLFTPFGMNRSQWGREAVLNCGASIPRDEELLTGQQFAERYLQPLSQFPALRGHVKEQAEILSITRSRTWKGDFTGSPLRKEDPFVLVCQSGDRQWTEQADYVLDCSGTYRNHNWAGAGGAACPGERESLRETDYSIPDILQRERQEFADKTTLVLGSGFSAATSIVALGELAESAMRTSAIWVTRTMRDAPMNRIPEDTLPSRDALADSANRLALASGSPIAWLPGRVVTKIQSHTAGGLQVELNHDDNLQELHVDRVIANVGYRPNRTLYEELQVHECYASQGPMKLAAALMGETSSDCLAQSSIGAESLRNPEPDFFILGMKSYGRDSRFLLKIGHQQILDVFSLISNDANR